MATITLECKGLPCPQPVLKCKESIESSSPKSLVVHVDNEAAKDNISRFLGTKGYETSFVQNGNEFVVTGVLSGEKTDECVECNVMSEEEINSMSHQKILVFIPSDVMGAGDDELGEKLIFNFLMTLKEMGDDLWRIVLVNSGVKLATAGNKCSEELKKLGDSGISILVCGTCLEHFDLTSSKEVGEVTNMLDIITSFQLASKTIRV